LIGLLLGWRFDPQGSDDDWLEMDTKTMYWEKNDGYNRD